jgi:L-ascorbate metabolism protein UlaG (beta-lactamase superfamily)
MTVEQAARVVAALKPQIFYPYHYGQVDEKTDIEALKSAVEGVTEIRVFPME